ncbi:MAG: SpoIIE family protein phosphatase, partial [Bacteroidales bacterium]|nr:SpoIIE family protein phosphatase [Bacteroidales bacterium]
PGALMSILGISLLNKIIIELPKPFDAADILNALRNEIKMALRQTGKEDETRDGMDISLCIFNKKKNKINFSGAYNSLIIIRDNEIIKYKADRMPIGIYYEEKPFTNQEIKLKKNDLLYMYSDGFPDQFGGDLKKKFLTKNLNNLLLDISEETLSRQKEILNVKFKAWKGELPQVDDIIILGFRI